MSFACTFLPTIIIVEIIRSRARSAAGLLQRLNDVNLYARFAIACGTFAPLLLVRAQRGGRDHRRSLQRDPSTTASSIVVFAP